MKLSGEEERLKWLESLGIKEGKIIHKYRPRRDEIKVIGENIETNEGEKEKRKKMEEYEKYRESIQR